MKQIIRLTESELKSIIRNSVNKILREDVLGHDWREKDNDRIMNNYEPFESQFGSYSKTSHSTPFDGMTNDHDWSVKGEETENGGDPTHYDNFSDDIVNV